MANKCTISLFLVKSVHVLLQALQESLFLGSFNAFWRICKLYIALVDLYLLTYLKNVMNAMEGGQTGMKVTCRFG